MLGRICGVKHVGVAIHVGARWGPEELSGHAVARRLKSFNAGLKSRERDSGLFVSGAARQQSGYKKIDRDTVGVCGRVRTTEGDFPKGISFGQVWPQLTVL